MRGSLVVGAGILIGNITGFARVLVTAYLLGTHARADALAVAVGPIDNLNTAIINTMLVAFVPLLMAQRDEDRAALFSRAWRVFPGLLLLLTVAIVLLAPHIVHLLGPGLAPAQHDDSVRVLRLLAPAVFFGGCSAVFAALLYTERRFLIPALFQAFVNGGMMLAALLLWRFIGIKGFAVGYTVGAAAQMSLTWWASRHLQRSGAASSVSLRKLLMRPAMFLIYAALLAGNIMLTRAFATHAGPGMAAAFDYCLRCVSVVVAYLVYPVTNSLLPEVARLRGLNETRHALRLIDRSAGVTACFAVLGCAVGILLRKPAISLLFQRGNFDAESTALVATVFLGFAPAIPGWALLDLISRCSFAMDRPIVPLVCAAIPITVNAVIHKMLPAGASTLAIGASAGLLAGFAALFIAAHFGRRYAGNGGSDGANVVLRVEEDLGAPHAG